MFKGVWLETDGYEFGYRVNSKNATRFRQWATQTLRRYIADGFAINPSRIEHHKSQFTKAIEDLKLELKQALLVKGEATDLFAQEKVSGAFEGVFGNVFQSIGGEDVYTAPET